MIKEKKLCARHILTSETFLKHKKRIIFNVSCHGTGTERVTIITVLLY